MQDPRIKTILDHYGKAHQRLKLVEEIGEMLAEVGRYLADGARRTNKANVVSELADVAIVVKQLYPNAFDGFATWLSGKDVGQKLCEKAAILASMVAAGTTTEKMELKYADATLAHINAFAQFLGEVPMLQMAIDMKLDRQINRILKAEGFDGSSR